jgi:hypothetical protein
MRSFDERFKTYLTAAVVDDTLNNARASGTRLSVDVAPEAQFSTQHKR